MDSQDRKLSIGIIMDGNRRWAKERNLPTLEGHRLGYAKTTEIVKASEKLPISTLIFYAFSKENWKREKEEVGYLMDLFRLAIQKDFESLIGKCQMKFIGDLSDLPKDLQDSIKVLEKKSAVGEKKMKVVIALSYGGRDEILRAVKKIKNPKDVDEAQFSKLLDTKGITDPDIIIRTSGEKRLSGFLPWQAVYSELFFVDKKWPDFTPSDLKEIIDEYQSRDRRFGK
jgi:undecaprenyl diphosphate synthase